MLQEQNTALLDELMAPLGDCLTPETARQIIQLRASPRLEARVDELARKTEAGTLTPDERADYETIVRFVKFVSVLQSKSRVLLREEAAD